MNGNAYELVSPTIRSIFNHFLASLSQNQTQEIAKEGCRLSSEIKTHTNQLVIVYP